MDKGRWVCNNCGAILDIAEKDPRVIIKGGGGKPNIRVLMLGGREIHRCEINPSATV